MITISRHSQIYHPDRSFLYVDVRSLGFGAGEPPPPIEQVYQWLAPAQAGDYWSREHIDRFLDDPRCPIDRDGVVVIAMPACSCCGIEHSRMPGHGLITVRPAPDPANRSYRCRKHGDRNPCAVEGCQRTTASKGSFHNDTWLCVEHWRMGCPPRTRSRRAYRRIFRLGKNYDGKWPPKLIAQYWRLWEMIVRRARRLAAGDVDMTEISKMFGWDV